MTIVRDSRKINKTWLQIKSEYFVEEGKQEWRTVSLRSFLKQKRPIMLFGASEKYNRDILGVLHTIDGLVLLVFKHDYAVLHQRPDLTTQLSTATLLTDDVYRDILASEDYNSPEELAYLKYHYIGRIREKLEH